MVMEEERIFNDPGVWASSFLRNEIQRQYTFCTYALLHAKTASNSLDNFLLFPAFIE